MPSDIIGKIATQLGKKIDMKIPEEYKGREQALIKHKLLETYLESLFMIIGQKQDTICYVDCFAGPWEESSADLSDTSIGISLKIMNKCREGLKEMGHYVKFKAIYVEKTSKSFKKLEQFLNSGIYPAIEARPEHGEFHLCIEKILSWCGPKDFTFFFIDPKGWKNAIEIPTLLPLLQRRNSEFLINFMYDFLSRFHKHEDYQEDMKSIFGKVPDTSEMNVEEKEKHFLSLYRESLKKAQPGNNKARSAYFSVPDPCKDRTKYHLVYLTRHPKGIVVFMTASEKLAGEQLKVRAQAKQDRREDKTKQIEMFSSETTIDNKEIECKTQFEVEKVKGYWLKKITSDPKRFDIIALADMVEETDWLISYFQKAFKELVDEGKVKNLDDTSGKRRKHFIHFDKSERLVEL